MTQVRLDVGGYGVADWAETPDEVLEAVDKLLAPYGLEVVYLETPDDAHCFLVERRPRPEASAPTAHQKRMDHALRVLTHEWQTSREMGASHYALRSLMYKGLVETTGCALYPDKGPHYGYRLAKRPPQNG